MLLTVVCHAQTTVYSWSSVEGVATEVGGTIKQHNAEDISRINNECSDYYVITLIGKGECITLQNNSEDAQYMEITLNDNNTFHEGDMITIGGMRNTTNTNTNATLFMQFDNGTRIIDNNIWNNLGELAEMTFGGGTGNSSPRKDASADDFTLISAFPSEYSFVVPAEAEGCKSLKLSRDICECRLYLTNILITCKNATGLPASIIKKENNINYKYINNEGVIVVGKYNVAGQRLQ